MRRHGCQVDHCRMVIVDIPPGAAPPIQQQLWDTVLTDGHASLVRARRVFRYLPSAPRCKVCNNPFGGPAGRLLAVAGFSPSRKNPNLCSRCCDSLPAGGAEVDVAVLFADVRSSTALGQRGAAADFAALLNRFYIAATQTLLRHDAVIDKLIGDEVMAFFVRGISGPQYRRRAVLAGMELLQSGRLRQPRGALARGGRCGQCRCRLRRQRRGSGGRLHCPRRSGQRRGADATTRRRRGVTRRIWSGR